MRVGKASTKGSSGLRPDEAGHWKVFRKSVPRRGNSKDRGREAGTSLAGRKRDKQDPDHIGSCFVTWAIHN